MSVKVNLQHMALTPSSTKFEFCQNVSEGLLTTYSIDSNFNIGWSFSECVWRSAYNIWHWLCLQQMLIFFRMYVKVYFQHMALPPSSTTFEFCQHVCVDLLTTNGIDSIFHRGQVLSEWLWRTTFNIRYWQHLWQKSSCVRMSVKAYLQYKVLTLFWTKVEFCQNVCERVLTTYGIGSVFNVSQVLSECVWRCTYIIWY